MNHPPVKKLSVSLGGHLLLDGRQASARINMLFRVTTDTLSPWRQDARDRFRMLMAENGLPREADAILQAYEKSH